MNELLHIIDQSFTNLLGPQWGPAAFATAWALTKVVFVVVPLLIFVLYFQLVERWVIGWIQVRRGPNRVTFFGIKWLGGFGQPVADAIKLLLKEQIVPTGASKALFLLAPAISVAPAMAVWSVVPFMPGWVIADADAGLLVILAMTSMGVYGIILAGWASNSKYAFLGAMRSAAQVVSYEIAMGFALVGGLMAAQSMNLSAVVARQDGPYGFVSWFLLPLLPLFVVHFIAGVAETNRHPFDVAEGESEIVAGPLVEYSGMTWSLFFLAEYANMLLVATVSSILFLGGWLTPIPHSWVELIPAGLLRMPFDSGIHWILIKMMSVMMIFVWIRASFPRYRYDQLMRLGWKVFIPLTIVWIVVIGVMMMDPVNSVPPFSWWFGKNHVG
ncbi:MAG: NADH-quinone oxidoreductase subunit NuoH [Betaproteobacteria bacterium]|nr:NADH-quinone oxidoreductase subunit NuoH [Betaproteobacteria bacterium]